MSVFKARGWAVFALTMGLILAMGILIGLDRRRELGQSFSYSLDEYRQVDPALVHYREAGRLQPEVGTLRALAAGPGDELVLAGDHGIEVYGPDDRLRNRFELDQAPSCLAVDEDLAIFAGFQNHIEVFDLQGQRIARWAPLGEKAYLTSIALTDDTVYAADAGGRTVWRLDRSGQVLGRIEGRQQDPDISGFTIPSPFFDAAIGTDDSLWVVNPGFHALENYRKDGTLVSAWEKTSMYIDGFSGCCNPSHIALLADGSFVTSEKGLPRVKVHSPSGELVSVVAAPDQFDEKVTGLDLAVDSRGRIFVLDPAEGAVRIFVKKENTP